MIVYSFLPLTAIFANLFLVYYVLYLNPRNRLNQLFSLALLSYAIMGLANYFMFNAISVSEAVFWNKIETIGSVSSTLILFHFALLFCKRRIGKNKIFLSLLYLSGIGFLIVEFGTGLITETMRSTYFGYTVVPAPLYSFLALYLTAIILISMIVCWHYYITTQKLQKKKQAKLIIIAFSFPIVGGISSQVISPFLSFEIIPLTAIFSTFTAIIISYTIFRYKLIKPSSLSIQKKIVTMFFILLYCMVFFTLTVSNVVSVEMMEDVLSDDLQAIAQSRANNVRSIVSKEMDRLNLLRSQKTLQSGLDQFNELKNESTKDTLRGIINDANKSVMDYKQIIVLNNSGIGVVSTNPVYENMDFSNQKFYKKSNLNNTMSLARIDQKIRIIINGPLIQDEERIGQIIILSSPDHLFDYMLDHKGLGDSGESYIVNESGVVLTPLRFFNSSENLEDIILKKKIETVNYRNCFTHANLTEEEIKLHHDEIEIFKDYRNISVVGTHIYIPEMNWALLVEVDESEAFAAINNVQMILSLILTFSALIMLAIAYVYSKNISRPIQQLNEVTNEIANGNLQKTVHIDSSDEIGSLAQSFNTMTNSLRDYTKDLEHQVDMRTKDLQEKIDELQRFKKVTVGRELKMVELKNELKRLKDNDTPGEFDHDTN